MIGVGRNGGAVRARCLLLVWVSAWVLFGPAARSAPVVPPVMQLAILLKILEYEKSVGQSGGPIRIGFVASETHAESLRFQAEMLQLLKNLGAPRVQGREVSGMGLTVGNYAQTGGLKVLYVGPGLEDHLKGIKAFSRAGKILTVTGVEGYMSQGISLGILPKKTDKPQIVLNAVEFQAEGASLDGRLLRLAVLLNK